jgi:hypothetical protein
VGDYFYNAIFFFNFILVDNEVSHCRNYFMDTIFKFLHSITFTLTLQISILTKAVLLNSFPHGRFGSLHTKKMLGILD